MVEEAGESVALALAVVGLEGFGACFGVVAKVAAFENDAQQGFGRNPLIGEEGLGETEILGQKRE